MFKKQIQKHNFLTGGPVLQYELPFDTEISFDFSVDNWAIDDGPIEGQLTINDEGVLYNGEPVPTEERVREIFREEYYNILREDLDNLG